MNYTVKIAIVLAVTLLFTATSFAGRMYAPPKNGLRVCIDSFNVEAFPQVEMLVRLLAPEKLDYRYFNGDHFGIIEEEVPVRDLRAVPFAPPMSISIVVDDSGSLENGTRYIKRALKHFIEELSEDDEASVTSFNRSVQVLQPMTFSKRELQKAVGTIKSYGATALYDGCMAGLAQLSNSGGKRVMLVVSDGNDQVYPGGSALSSFNLQKVLRTAKQGGVEVYSIAVGNVEKFGELKTLSESTNGLFWCAPSPSYLKPLFDKVTTSLGGLVKVYYTSPNANFDRKDRTVVLDVRRGKYHGQSVSTYWLDYKTPGAKVTVSREKKIDNKLSNFRLFTWGTNRLPLELEFYLYDPRGNLVRHGITTKDGFGRLERSKAPQLTNLEKGTYRLVLRKEGIQLDFDHPMVTIDPSTTLTMSLGFSKLVFRRDGQEWYSMAHRLGNCAELLKVSVLDEASNKVVYAGLLDDFLKNREVAFWLQEGAYKVTLENKWPVVDNSIRQEAILKNALVSRFRVSGGQELYFDTQEQDFIVSDPSVVSREYQFAHADESPYKAPTPVSQKEVQVLAKQQARRYKSGTFTRHREHHLQTDSLYTHQSGASLDKRIDRLMAEKVPAKVTARRAENADSRTFDYPYHNESLNASHRSIHNGPKPARMTPPPVEASWDERYPSAGDEYADNSDEHRGEGGAFSEYGYSGEGEEEIFDEGPFYDEAVEMKRIDPLTRSRAEELRYKAHTLVNENTPLPPYEAPVEESAASSAVSVDYSRPVRTDSGTASSGYNPELEAKKAARAARLAEMRARVSAREASAAEAVAQ